MGQTTGGRRWLEITRRSRSPVSLEDGAVSRDGRVWGCYLHGLFENSALRQAWLSELGWRGHDGRASPPVDRAAAFDDLADAVEATLDMQELERIVWGS